MLVFVLFVAVAVAVVAVPGEGLFESIRRSLFWYAFAPFFGLFARNIIYDIVTG